MIHFPFNPSLNYVNSFHDLFTFPTLSLKTSVRSLSMKVAGTIAVCLFASPFGANAQRHALSLNSSSLPSATLSVEESVALSRHFTIGPSVQFSPFTGRDSSPWNRQRSLSLGARYYPWNVYSGFWAEASLTAKQWSTVKGFPKVVSYLSGTPGVIPSKGLKEENFIEEDVVPRPSFPDETPLPPAPFRPTTEGDAYGVGISAGYSLMLSRRINLDFGIGIWGGKYFYRTYACPTCGKTISEGHSFFILPSEADLSLVYIF